MVTIREEDAVGGGYHSVVLAKGSTGTRTASGMFVLMSQALKFLMLDAESSNVCKNACSVSSLNACFVQNISFDM